MSRDSPSAGARQKMSGEDAKQDITQSQQIEHQVFVLNWKMYCNC